MVAHRNKDSRDRRHRGGGALDIQGTLGTLLRTTLQQVGVVKDVVERQARSSLANLDQVMLQRKRRDALVRLGEVVYDLGRGRQLGALADHAEVAEALAEIEDIDARLDQEGAEPAEAVSSADWRPPGSHGRSAADSAGQRVWRPVVPPDDDSADLAPATGAGDDADSRSDRSPQMARPQSEDESESAPTPGRARRRRPRQRDAGGGIAFISDAVAEDDEDLSEYMHEDDVPRRG